MSKGSESTLGEWWMVTVPSGRRSAGHISFADLTGVGGLGGAEEREVRSSGATLCAFSMRDSVLCRSRRA